MSAAHRGRAERHRLENTVAFQARWRPPAHFSGSAFPQGDDSAQHAHRKRLSFVSFVSKAVLWEREGRTYSFPVRPALRPSMCPRFLSHMKKENLKVPPVVSFIPHSPHTPHTTRTRPPEGWVPVSPDGGTRCLAKLGSRAERQLPVVSPPSSTDRATIRSTFRSKLLLPPLLEKAEALDGRRTLREETPDIRRGTVLEAVTSPTSSLSELIRLPSSLFRRSEDLTSGRSSILRASNDEISAFDSSSRRSSLTGGLVPPVSDTVTETKAHLSSLSPSHTLPLIHEPHEDLLSVPGAADETAEISDHGSSSCRPSLIDGFSDPLSETKPHQPSKSPTHTSPSTYEHGVNQASTFPPCSPPIIHADREKLLSCETVKDELQHESKAPRLKAFSVENRVPSALSSAASHPSPQMVSPLSEVRAALLSPHWPVLPSISTLRDLSPGLDALTVACDSGNLGSLSRVQLLFLDRAVLDSEASPLGLEEEEEEEEEEQEEQLHPGWRSGSLGVSGAWSLSAGKVQEEDFKEEDFKEEELKEEYSQEEVSASPSWIIDPSSTTNMFSSFQSEHSSHTEERDKDSAGGERPDHREVMSVLAKLQQEMPRQGQEGHEGQEGQEGQGRSNFEDFDFLSKFCIFTGEKLAEYSRVFQAADLDQDGFLSFPQVLEALKRIVPAELLSDDEQVYVYRILEMVDFRVMDGLVDLRLFAVISSLAEKISSMDDFLRSLLSTVDFRSLEVKLFKAKQLFLFLVEDQSGLINAEHLLLELKAGGIRLEREDAVLRELRRKPPLDLLDFLAHLPLFMLVHKTVVSNPLNDGGDNSSIT